MPRNHTKADNWSAKTKLSIVVETALLSESNLSEYCREKGFYTEQIKQWENQCLTGFCNGQVKLSRMNKAVAFFNKRTKNSLSKSFKKPSFSCLKKLNTNCLTKTLFKWLD